MELKQYLSTLWKWGWLIALATALASIASYWNSSQMTPVYRTTTTLLVGQFFQSSNPQAGDFFTSQQLAQSYAQLVRRQPLLQATISALGLDRDWDRLAEEVNATAIAGTQLIQISVVDTDPRRGAVIADELANQLILQSPTPQEKAREQHQQFIDQQLSSLQSRIAQAETQIEDLEKRMTAETSARGLQDIQNQIGVLQQKITTWQGTYTSLLDIYKGSRTNYLSVVEPASVPDKPFAPNIFLNILLAACLGFVLAAGAAFLMEYLDDTIKTHEDVNRVLNLPTIGAVARIQGIHQPTEGLVALHHPFSPITEAYRVLRTNVQFTSVNNPTLVLLVTSSLPGEGKTTTASNLAIAMAQGGKRVILADTDLRRPDVNRLFGLSNERGLTSLLLDDALPMEAALRETAQVGLKVLTSGPLPPNPAELLGSEPMKKRLAQMREMADVIIFDSPPVLPVADASIMGALCSGLVLVVDAGRTRSNVVRRAKMNVEQVGVKILGVAINKLKVSSGDYYHYHYRYHSRSSANPSLEDGGWARRIAGTWSSVDLPNRIVNTWSNILCSYRVTSARNSIGRRNPRRHRPENVEGR